MASDMFLHLSPLSPGVSPDYDCNYEEEEEEDKRVDLVVSSIGVRAGWQETRISIFVVVAASSFVFAAAADRKADPSTFVSLCSFARH